MATDLCARIRLRLGPPTPPSHRHWANAMKSSTVDTSPPPGMMGKDSGTKVARSFSPIGVMSGPSHSPLRNFLGSFISSAVFAVYICTILLLRSGVTPCRKRVEDIPSGPKMCSSQYASNFFPEITSTTRPRMSMHQPYSQAVPGWWTRGNVARSSTKSSRLDTLPDMTPLNSCLLNLPMRKFWRPSASTGMLKSGRSPAVCVTTSRMRIGLLSGSISPSALATPGSRPKDGRNLASSSSSRQRPCSWSCKAATPVTASRSGTPFSLSCQPWCRL
mmetsp:Transcript_51111/g.158341  ORF Transcript_51111/g.158341 Transcript_51111/m.158341 type:complete len:275 (-) Transcript_51111:155-979(-)